ncbi:MAG: glycosyltransferase family 2 protein [Lachnospiraceae bacterium]
MQENGTQAELTEEQIRNLLEYYKEVYANEKQKNHQLAGKLADAQVQVEDLTHQLKRIKDNPLWKVTKPLRALIHLLIRTKDRIVRLGNPKGILRKLRSKRIERQAKKQHGKASFPTKQERMEQQKTIFPLPITFSILVPLYNTPMTFLTQMLDSVMYQTYEGWELCLADGSDAQHAYVEEVCRRYMTQTDKIKYQRLEKNEGISGNTNRCYEMATGNYIALFDHDDILHPSVLYEYMKVICEKGADYIYCDEATFKGDDIDHMITLHFKSDYAIDTLRANNYICHFSAFSRHLLEGTELFRAKFDGSQDHDMILRLTSAANHVEHVQKLLYYWRSHKGSVASDISAKTYAIEAARGAVTDHLLQQGFKDFDVISTRAFETIFRIKYRLLSNPKISIIIGNADHCADLRRCITSILDKSTYDNYEIIIVENNSTESDIKDYYAELEHLPNVTVVIYHDTFNYSKVNNYGVSFATGDYILLLNNDTQVISPNWMEELLMYAQREDVGAVGAKLYYADKTIQHAGIVIGLGAHRTAGHTHYKVNYENVGYMGKLCYAQDVTAVTGACLLVRSALYKEVGGLDETYAIALNDVDFCLRLRKLGFLNVFNPYCELYHFESQTRGLDSEEAVKAARYEAEAEQFRTQWKEELAKGDPYYNPNFSLDRSDYSLKVLPDRQL